MALICSAEEAIRRNLFEEASIAFGVFDGIHRGHSFLLEQVIKEAVDRGEASIALTFDVDPDEILRPDLVKKLMSNEERLNGLASSGIDFVVVLPFTDKFASLDALSFLERLFGYRPPFSIHVGADFRFGRKGLGSVEDLRFWADRTGSVIYPYNLETEGGRPIAATRIRECLARGDVKEAALLLGRSYSVTAQVMPGRQEGRHMGFRTANIAIPRNQLILREGVYGGYALVDGVRYKAAISMGASPTFEEAVAVCEVHILDFEGDIYHTNITVEFAEWLRPMIKFDSVDELIATVMGNIQWCRDNL